MISNKQIINERVPTLSRAIPVFPQSDKAIGLDEAAPDINTINYKLEIIGT